MSLGDLIHAHIRTSGPMSVARYMELCLLHPEFGYYTRRDPLGAAGDFITAPEISQIFGELIGLWLAAQWEKLGKPAKATLLELGPGRGTLMADALRATQKAAGFHEAVSVRLLEASPTLKQKQWHALAGKHPDIEWIDSLTSLAKGPLFVIANEFFDALPIRQFAGDKERMIELKGDQLAFSLPAENIHETCEEALHMMHALATHIEKHQGAALIVDYGYAQGGKGDTLQAMRHHAYHDPLRDPGEADLTAHVDFAALAKAATGHHVRVHGPVAQGKFLMAVGAGQRLQKLCANASSEQSSALMAGLNRLASPDQMGDLFKVLAITSPSITHAEGF